MLDEESGCSGEDDLGYEEKPKDIAKNETRAVFWSRLLVFVVLLVTAVAVSVLVLVFLKRNEFKSFEKQTEEDINKIFDEIGGTLDQILEATDSFMVDSVSYASTAGVVWPYVTIPDFAIKASKFRSLSRAMLISMSPVVQLNDMQEWENYSYAEGPKWVNDGLETQRNDELFKGTLVSPDLWQEAGFHLNTGPLVSPETPMLLPTWQTAPVVPFFPPYNWEVYTYFSKEMDEVVGNRKVVISESRNLPKQGEPAVTMEDHTVLWVQGFIGADEDPSEPLTVMYYPVVDNALERVSAYKENGTVVSVIAVSFFWRELVRGILPEGSKGLYVVIGNECGQVMTYKLDGPKAHYVGPKHYHDDKYSSLQRSCKFTDLSSSLTRNRMYSGFDLSSDFCPHWVRVYPSDEMLSSFRTKYPLLMAANTALVFVFAFIAFSIFVYYTERRQRTVMTTAVRSSEIVDSFFPSNFRQKIFEHRSKECVANTSGGSSETRSESEDASESNPIAELFTDTSVAFLDVAGFTAWSSARDPSLVFLLLEKIYGAFDAIAKRRGVFKVETIGDCFVAATGVPFLNAHHASSLVRFAEDCRLEFNEIVTDLEETLGPGTSELKLRTGINSGATTGGVLRGEKSRFQLFGDTVNTASRMESLGAPDRIHVSQTTAQLLMAAGKSAWLVKRDDLVNAKGKGKMQTYWIRIRRASAPRMEEAAALSPRPKKLGHSWKGWCVNVLEFIIREVVSSRKTEGIDGIILELSVLDEQVVSELSHYVNSVASKYPTLPFCNFERASHVLLSMTKLMKSVLECDEKTIDPALKMIGAQLDPLTRFACVFSALTCGIAGDIHLAEYNSAPEAYHMLQANEYKHLQKAIAYTKEEEVRFLQLVTNYTATATEINSDLYKNAWSEGCDKSEATPTEVLSLILQASLMSHSMQHWNIFCKWNAALFCESHKAFVDGQAADPSLSWSGLDFFDYCVMPIANKLASSNLFGVVGVEYLSYAKANREEWERLGVEIVAELKEGVTEDVVES